jgi:hypothetical protein
MAASWASCKEIISASVSMTSLTSSLSSMRQLLAPHSVPRISPPGSMTGTVTYHLEPLGDLQVARVARVQDLLYLPLPVDQRQVGAFQAADPTQQDKQLAGQLRQPRRHGPRPQLHVHVRVIGEVERGVDSQSCGLLTHAASFTR